ncbi:MAG: hypothetical protein MdMp014T_2961 [Treponematales bacterium]|jgi:hypothetical protein
MKMKWMKNKKKTGKKYVQQADLSILSQEEIDRIMDNHNSKTRPRFSLGEELDYYAAAKKITSARNAVIKYLVDVGIFDWDYYADISTLTDIPEQKVFNKVLEFFCEDRTVLDFYEWMVRHPRTWYKFTTGMSEAEISEFEKRHNMTVDLWDEEEEE